MHFFAPFWLIAFCLLTLALDTLVAHPADAHAVVKHDATTQEPKLKPIPDKLVVLTFDDSAKSHFTVVRPLLKRHGFGGTFFVTKGFDFPDNKKDYMTWKEISQLHKDGFEIGNPRACNGTRRNARNVWYRVLRGQSCQEHGGLVSRQSCRHW